MHMLLLIEGLFQDNAEVIHIPTGVCECTICDQMKPEVDFLPGARGQVYGCFSSVTHSRLVAKYGPAVAAVC